MMLLLLLLIMMMMMMKCYSSVDIVLLCIVESRRPSTFPRGRCPVSTSTSHAAVSAGVCGCGVIDCSHSNDRSHHVEPVLSRSVSSSSSGIGSMTHTSNTGLCETTSAASCVRPAPSVPVQKCKCSDVIDRLDFPCRTDSRRC